MDRGGISDPALHSGSRRLKADVSIFFLPFCGPSQRRLSTQPTEIKSLENMKLPVFHIPLAYFAATMCALVGFLLGALVIGELPKIDRLSFLAICNLIGACLSISICVCALALACKRAWARSMLVYLLLAVAFLFVATLAHDFIRFAPKDGRVVSNLIAAPIVLSAPGLSIAFLLNRPLVDELDLAVRK